MGAKDAANLKKMIRLAFIWGVGFGLVFAVIYIVAGDLIIRIFTSNKEVIALCGTYWIWIMIAPFVNSFCFIWDGVYIGATATKAMRNTMIICAFAVFLPCVIFLRAPFGNHGLWLSFTLFMAARGIALTLCAQKHIYSIANIKQKRASKTAQP